MDEQKKQKRNWRISIWLLKVTVFIASGAAASHYAGLGAKLAHAKLSEVRASIAERFESVKVVREYLPREQKPLGQIVKEASERHAVSSLLLVALMHQESGKQLRTDRMRYEPHLQGRFKCAAWMNDAECKSYATSWGLTQVVYGFWKERCGLESYSDLLNPEINVQCGASILGECLKRRHKLDKMQRYRECLGEYNGDRTGRYASEVLQHLTEIVIEQEL